VSAWDGTVELQCSADFDARRRLHSTSSSSLTVSRARLSIVGDRAFPVAAAHLEQCLNMSRPDPPWRLSSSGIPILNSLPQLCSAYAVTVVIFGHLNRSFSSYILLLELLLHIGFELLLMLIHVLFCCFYMQDIVVFWTNKKEMEYVCVWKQIHQYRRLARAQAFHMSDEEKRRRRLQKMVVACRHFCHMYAYEMHLLP